MGAANTPTANRAVKKRSAIRRALLKQVFSRLLTKSKMGLSVSEEAFGNQPMSHRTRSIHPIASLSLSFLLRRLMVTRAMGGARGGEEEYREFVRKASEFVCRTGALEIQREREGRQSTGRPSSLALTYSPMSWTTSFLVLGLTSNSTRTI